MRRLDWLWMGVALVAAGCTPNVTSFAVVVDTDLLPPGEIDQITLRVEGAGGLNATSTTALTADSPTLPLNIVVATKADDLNAPINFTASALLRNSDGVEHAVVSNAVMTHFVEGKSLLLRILLTRACVATSCGGGETCNDGVCVAATVDPLTLPLYTGTLPPPLVPREMSELDGSTDAPIDASIDTSIF